MLYGLQSFATIGENLLSILSKTGNKVGLQLAREILFFKQGNTNTNYQRKIFKNFQKLAASEACILISKRITFKNTREILPNIVREILSETIKGNQWNTSKYCQRNTFRKL